MSPNKGSFIEKTTLELQSLTNIDNFVNLSDYILCKSSDLKLKSNSTWKTWFLSVGLQYRSVLIVPCVAICMVAIYIATYIHQELS